MIKLYYKTTKGIYDMIRITILDEDHSLDDIKRGEMHWSNICEFDALIEFDYDNQNICEFYTMHHFMLLQDMSEAILNLLTKGKQVSFRDYGYTYNKQLTFKMIDEDVHIMVYPQKEKNSVIVSPKVLALDFLRALKEIQNLYCSYRTDNLNDNELNVLREYIKKITKTVSQVS